MGASLSRSLPLLQPPPVTNQQVELERFVGVWYEYSRLPNSFQSAETYGRATYTQTSATTFEILNESLDYETELPLRRKSITGTATAGPLNGKFKVNFHRVYIPLADYWIYYLDRAYTIAVIVSPDRKHLWVLLRSLRALEDVNTGLELLTVYNSLRKDGFDVDKIRCHRHFHGQCG